MGGVVTETGDSIRFRPMALFSIESALGGAGCHGSGFECGLDNARARRGLKNGEKMEGKERGKRG